MISVPPNIQAQLGEAISIIADSDFYERWETLIDVSYVPMYGSWIDAKVLTGPSVTPNPG